MKIQMDTREWSEQGWTMMKEYAGCFLTSTPDGVTLQPLTNGTPQGNLVGTGDVFTGWIEEEALGSLAKTIGTQACTALVYRVGKVGDQRPFCFTICK